MKPSIDATSAGAQCVLPGAERASLADVAKRQALAPLKPTAAQQPCDVGLFGDTDRQISLF